MNNDFFQGENIKGELFGFTGRPNGPKYGSKGSRAEFEKFYQQVPKPIRAELKMGNLRLGDQIVYSIKPIGASTTIKLFETQDDKKIGLRNVSNAKLPKNQALLVSGIYILAGTTQAQQQGSPTDDEIMSTHFYPISANPAYAALTTGEFNLKANKVQLVPETSMRIFANDFSGFWPKGYYKLHNPRLIQDDVLIEATLELGTVRNIPQDTFVYIGLCGTITTP